MGQKVRERREKGGIWSPVNLKEWGNGVQNVAFPGLVLYLNKVFKQSDTVTLMGLTVFLAARHYSFALGLSHLNFEMKTDNTYREAEMFKP